MRIGIDVSTVIGPPSGLRRYTEQLLQGLSEIDSKNQYVLYAGFWRDFPARAADFACPTAPNFKLVLQRIPQRLVFTLEERVGLRIEERLLSRHRLDLLHGVANILPRLKCLASVVTLHHIGETPDMTGPWSRLYFHDLTQRATLTADKVIAVSEHTKKEAIRQFGVDGAKVETIWEGGASAAFQKPHDPDRPKGLGVQKPYILFVSAVNLRKNLSRLVRAFSILCRSGNNSHQLLLVGKRDASYATLREEIRQLGAGPRVTFLEGLNSDDLNALYREADLFVYPSLIEGFGLPVLEAMTCGIPAIVANASCLPEIAGDAALYFNGEDETDLARKMTQVLSDPGLRRDLIEKGRKRAGIFSWRETARKTLQIYETVVASRARNG